MKLKIQHTGFTLIELMIVIAIIGILAAIAIPIYQDYLARTQVIEALKLMDGMKTRITDKYIQDGSFANASIGDPDMPASAVALQGNYVAQVDLQQGVMTATMKGSLPTSSLVYNGTVVLSPITKGNSVIWACKRAGAQPIDQKHLPSTCR